MKYNNYLNRHREPATTWGAPSLNLFLKKIGQLFEIFIFDFFLVLFVILFKNLSLLTHWLDNFSIPNKNLLNYTKNNILYDYSRESLY